MGFKQNACMTLTELKYIVAVAREKHFGRAADACHVSQPTLSVAIKKLEVELEVKLFERNASEIAVTPLGEDIVRQAQSVLEQADSIREIAKRGKNPLDGPLLLSDEALGAGELSRDGSLPMTSVCERILARIFAPGARSGA